MGSEVGVLVGGELVVGELVGVSEGELVVGEVVGASVKIGLVAGVFGSGFLTRPKAEVDASRAERMK